MYPYWYIEDSSTRILISRVARVLARVMGYVLNMVYPVLWRGFTVSRNRKMVVGMRQSVGGRELG